MNEKIKENQIQEAVFEWAKMKENRIPELKLLFHVPNEGKRSPATGAIMKRAGLKAGVPDICLPVPRLVTHTIYEMTMFHGLWIELKAGHKKPTVNQERWLTELTEHGHLCYVCENVGAAVAAISSYLRIRPEIDIDTEDLEKMYYYDRNGGKHDGVHDAIFQDLSRQY